MMSWRARTRSLAQPLRFGAVGVVNTLLDWAVFAAGVRALPSVPSWHIKAASFSVGIFSSFVFNSLWTFKDEYARLRARARERETDPRVLVFARFAIVSLTCLVLNALAYFVVVDSLAMSRLVGLVVATAVTFVFGFWLNRAWTFASKNDDHKGDGSGARA